METEDFLAGLGHRASAWSASCCRSCPARCSSPRAVVVWAIAVGAGRRAGWRPASRSLLLAVGTLVKYLLPGRHLKTPGHPDPDPAWLGGLLGVVGFFVVPVVGLPLGFVLGVYLAEAQRLGPTPPGRPPGRRSRRSGASILIELAAGLVAAVVWLVGAVAT